MSGSSARNGGTADAAVDGAWVEAVRALWPGAAVERVPAGRMPAGVRRELTYLPNAAQPRLLLPSSAGTAAAALHRYSQDLGPRQRLARAAATTAMRTGVPQRTLHDRLAISGGGESVEDALGELLGHRVVVSVGLGGPRANRKPILHVLTPKGRQLAFVKVGDTESARGLIDVEGTALRHLNERPLPGLAVPRVLHLGDWSGLRLLVLSALPGGLLGWRPRSRPPLAAMRTVFAVDGVQRSRLAGSAFHAGLHKAPAHISEPGRAERFGTVLSRVDEAYGDLEFDFGAWHGDWTPWNMTWHRGTAQVWDWERFAGDVPNGFDLLHYRLQASLRSRPEPSYSTMPIEATAWLRPLGMTGQAARATLDLYLTELCRRYLIAAQGPIGEPLRPQADRLLDLLSAHAGLPDARRTL